MSKNKRKVVFDLCDVLVLTSYKKVLEHFLPDRPNLSKIDKDFQYYQFSLGKLSPDNYFNHFIKKYDFVIGYSDFVIGWNKLFIKEALGIENLLYELSSKYELIVLSNINKIHANHFLKEYNNLSRYFAFFLFSYELGLRKPNEEIFTKLLSLSEPRNPKEFLFIDDKEENILAANRLSIESILFKNVESLRISLNNLGILK
jgi:glucose-1-phosphatase